MKELGRIEKLSLREVWSKEAADFTPWLAENISELGDALGLELELEAREASVGDFSLDLLAKDLGSNHVVVIENQLTPTNHDHLGKLLTYASGFGAHVVIWVAESIRDEHRQALEWLNQRTEAETAFFGVVVEVLRIDQSRPAFNFKPVVYPNEWQKTRQRNAPSSSSPRGDAYRTYFQGLLDELREKHKFTGARAAQPQNWHSFSSGLSGIQFGATFASGDKVRANLYLDTNDAATNKAMFDWMFARRADIERDYGQMLEWDRLDDNKVSRIYVVRNGSIECDEPELRDIQAWQVEHLLRMKRELLPYVKLALKAVRG